MKCFFVVLVAGTMLPTHKACRLICPKENATSSILLETQTLSSKKRGIIETCHNFALLLETLPPLSDEECNFLQHTASAYCCADEEAFTVIPPQDNNPPPRQEESCQLCAESSLAEPEKTIQFSSSPSSNEVSLLVNELLVPTCAMAQAFLLNKANDDASCLRYKEMWKHDCSCLDTTPKVVPKGKEQERHQDNDNKSAVMLLSKQQRQLMLDEQETCYLCADNNGDDGMAFPERILASDLLQAALPSVLLEQGRYSGVIDTTTNTTTPSLSCADVQILLALDHVNVTSTTCTNAQFLLSGVCGCPTQASQPCAFFHDIDDPERLVYSFQALGLPPMECGDVPFFLDSLENNNPLCLGVNMFGYLCDEPGTVLSPFLTRLSWIARISAFLSFWGSIYILYDVFKQYRAGTAWTMFNQLIAAISACDVQMSIAFMFASFLVPAENEFGEPSGYKGARGNETTCKLQGFMLQFGMTGVIYQISLSTYYLLVIYYGWQECRLKKYVCYFHIPFWVGLFLAFVGIPYYENRNVACMIASPPVVDTYAQITMFVLLPIFVTAMATLTNMALVYLKVRRQFASGNRWRLFRVISSRRKLQTQSTAPSDGNPAPHPPRPTTRVSLDKDLFWQCVLYLGAFYVCWFFMCIAQVQRLATNQTLWKFIAAMVPLQGFFNFLVYIRPRIAKAYRTWLVRRWDRRYKSGERPSDQPTHALTSSTPTRMTEVPETLKKAEVDEQSAEIEIPPVQADGASTDGSVESEFDDEFQSGVRVASDDDEEFHTAQTSL